jgi:glutamate-5-semialdehyde dehydrogenase
MVVAAESRSLLAQVQATRLHRVGWRSCQLPKNQALELIAQALEQNAAEILAANQADLAAAQAAQIAQPLIDRLKLTRLN